MKRCSGSSRLPSRSACSACSKVSHAIDTLARRRLALANAWRITCREASGTRI
jgi:hypothetical protein